MNRKAATTQFRDAGYVVYERLLDRDEIQAMRAAAGRIVAAYYPEEQRSVFSTLDEDAGRDDWFMGSAEAVRCFLEEDALDESGELRVEPALAINKIGHALHDHVAEFTAACRHPAIAEILRQIGYSAPEVWQTMYIFKQPRIGGEVRWHQDASYLHTTPAGVTGVWMALEDAHRDNGCLWVHPGGHRTPLRELYEVDERHPDGARRELDASPWPTQDQAAALEVPAGSVVVFSDHLPHYSSPNHSSESRHAFTMHVAERGARWSPRNWLQRPTLAPFPVFADAQPGK